MTAIIVLNYNDWVTTTAFIEKIKNYKNVDKVIVVDNCSSDESWGKLFPLSNERVDVIRSDANRGYAAGNNCGIRYVREYYPEIDKVIISNPDITVSDDGIGEILAKLDNGYGMATGLIHNYDIETETKSLASNFCWKVPMYNDLLWNHFLPIYKFRRVVLKNSIYPNLSDYKGTDVIDTECVPGCFFAIRMDVLLEIGDFDESTFLFTEETILGWNLKYRNKKVCVLKDVEIHHEQSTSINKSIRSRKVKMQYQLDGEKYYIKKYLQKPLFWVGFFSWLFWVAFIGNTCIIMLGSHKKENC